MEEYAAFKKTKHFSLKSTAINLEATVENTLTAAVLVTGKPIIFHSAAGLLKLNGSDLSYFFHLIRVGWIF